MTQGIFIGMARPKSKKAIREAVAAGLAVYAESTSFHGGEFSGNVHNLPVGQQVVFAGPDPYRDRRFYGTIKSTATGIKVV